MIGCEFAAVFAALGSRVTVVELLDQLLPGEDKRTGRTLQPAFKKAGIEVRAQGRRGGRGPATTAVTLRLADGSQVAAGACWWPWAAGP